MANLSLRQATPDDAGFLLEVRNHPDVRFRSKTQEIISRDTHEIWLKGHLNKPGSAIWIIEGQGQREGYVRAEEIENGTWLLSIALQGEFQHKGYGSWALWEACRLLRETHGARCLVAEVLATNGVAACLFERAGFLQKARTRENGLDLLRFELELGEPPLALRVSSRR